MECSLHAQGLKTVHGSHKTIKFGLHIVTWNVGTAAPPDDITALLQLEAQMQETDMYVIGLQELNSKVPSFLIDMVFYDPWTVFITNFLAPLGYVKVSSIRMQGLLLLICVKHQHLPYICDLQTSYTRTGLFGYWGNKGAVAARLSVYGHLLCFLNCHLPAHLHNSSQRISTFQRILAVLRFPGRPPPSVLDHDLLFWFGDLNFRIADHGLHFIRDTIGKKRFHLLWDKDQLNKAKQAEPVLQGFLEGQLLFKPTYKFNLDSTDYDTSEKRRKPAWTDRILWRVKAACPDRGTGSGAGSQWSDARKPIAVTLNIYDSQMQYGVSDHKPVLATFSLELERRMTQPLVELQAEGEWVPGKDAIISYCPAQDYSSSSWDWIGLFKVGFRSPRDYVTYLWVKDDELLVNEDVYQVFLNGEDVPEVAGDYILCYYSSNMDCIVGVSCPFQILPECAGSPLEMDARTETCDAQAHGDSDTC
ncbi:LOW QUALITY PROTEIN: inositol polyphosphate 5-phosphatase K-like [Mobula birostris]|uniref:LOW QUALITY PROTEIN: inositol polyphosphate 5-phosphatase K-like n=1 Tax=Mobula birostris TaxID=1983395 RepID=UPI003B283AC8